MSKYFVEHDKVFVAPNGAKDILDNLPPAQYILRKSPLIGYYLEKAGAFTVPEKIFGDVEKRVQRVIKTYFTRNCNTGILLSGDKGSGKTMFARLLSITAIQHGIPTVIVGDNFDNDMGLNKFLSDIEERCIILFDEFEKTFDEDNHQNRVLTLFDGTYQSNKLFVLTVNNTFKVSPFIMNRPGRVYYHFRYGGVEEEFIKEFCEHHLNNKQHVQSFLQLSKIIGKFNFDMLQSMVQECNIHDESPADIYQFMNIDIDNDKDKFSYVLTKAGCAKKQNGIHRGSVYDHIYLYWKNIKEDTVDDEDNDDDEDGQGISFEYADIVRFDKDSGVFVYEKGDFTMTMKREKRRPFFSFSL